MKSSTLTSASRLRSVLQWPGSHVYCTVPKNTRLFASKRDDPEQRTYVPYDSKLPFPLFADILKFGEKRVAFTDFKGTNFTYDYLTKVATSLATSFTQITEGKTERIAFLCDRDISFPATMLAAWFSSCTAVPLSPSHPDDLLHYFIETVGAKVLVGTHQNKKRLQQVARKTGSRFLEVDIEKVEPATEKLEICPENYAEKGALILFTSGTTGKPKGVLLTHSNLHAQVDNICDAWKISEKDCMLHVLPLHHTHGLIHALISPLTVGARCHMLEKFDAKKTWDQLLSTQDFRPNVIMGVPTVYIKLLQEYENDLALTSSKREFVKATCKQNMRVMISGSAALPVPVLEEWELATGHRLLERYGMTEIGMALTNPLKGERKPGFVGLPFRTVQVGVADLSSRESFKLLAEGTGKHIRVHGDPQNVTGDLLIKGPSVFKEYWNNPEATKKEFTPDGWFITGDSVQYSEGSFKILGRKSVDILKSGGYKLSALEIETQLLSLPEVKEVAILGLPDPTWGQKVAAVIAWSGKELSLQELKELAQKKLPSYACPTVLKTLSELPRNHLGKVNKKDLAKIFEV